MASEKLARIQWQMGQALLPEHLIAQEESILSEMRLRFEMSGIPLHGIGRLQWNESLLKEGVLSIVALTLVLPSGEIIDVPGNTRAKPFNLNIAGMTQMSIYLHVLTEVTDTSKSFSFNAPQKDDTIDRIIHQIEFSPNQSYGESVHSMKLAQFQKNAEGVWGLSDEYIPSLTQVGTSPFLMNTINELTQAMELFHFKLEREIMASYLSGESLFIARLCMQGLYKLKHFFSNLKNQVHYHPYYVYEALKSFYIDLSIYQNCTPENFESPYLHDQLADCFRSVCEPLMKQIQQLKAQNPYMPFKKEEGMFAISKLPKEAKDAKEVYFLIQKPKVTTILTTEGIKLASMSRIAMMHQMSLQGIPYKKIDRPPFQHSFGVEVEFFLLIPGEEWDHALGERTLAFYDQPNLEGIQAYIYWRQ